MRTNHVRSEYVDRQSTDVHLGPGRYSRNHAALSRGESEELMYRVLRRPESKLIALLPAAEPPPTFHELERNLSRACLPVTLRQNTSGSRIRALLQEGSAPRTFDVEVNATDAVRRLLDFAPVRRGALDAARTSRFFVSVSGKLGRNALDSLHAQVRLLAAVAPDAVAMVDANALHARTGDWMRDAASASVAPSPASFFTVHSVFGDAPKHRETWLHTHGLHRMGSIELDIVGIRRRHAPALTELLNNVARYFLEFGVPHPDTRFDASQGLPLVWLPWEDGLAHVHETVGRPADRDADHCNERGILLASMLETPKLLESPACYVPLIESDPIFYVSPRETERMQRLARERLPSFLALQARFAKNRKWEFHVKLGIPSDGNGQGKPLGGTEHLWFDVHQATPASVEATLLSHPWSIPDLRAGQLGIYDLHFLTDWSIGSPRGRYTPETVLELERALANDQVPARTLLN
jgi:hypothetical protein